MSFLDRFRIADPARISAEDFVARRSADGVVVDVRTPGEFAGGHLDGAVLMDVSSAGFLDRAAALDPRKTYYLYCRSGSRSGQATAILRGLGFENAYNAGGIDALLRAGAPINRR